uniref:DUF4159 domain-containing protein n=1 Tax=Oculatella sp. LEGE 06141 TaxID=1828648 RepID=UPI0018828F1A
VCGLGVRAIPAPSQGKSRNRDDRWIQVQPGIAIDVQGNLIVIPKPFNYHIDTELAGSDPMTVYLVTSYRDPDELQRDRSGETVQETYRLEETTSLPQPLEVELCRILIQPGSVAISHPDDVFFPGYNQLDLRYRIQAQTRPQALMRLAQVNRDDPDCARHFFNLSYLLQAVEALYPQMKGADEVGQVSLADGGTALMQYDLLYLTGRQKLELGGSELDALREYVQNGGVLLVDTVPEATELIETVRSLAQQLGHQLQPLTNLRNHPLRTRPFLFAALPLVNQHPIQLSIGGGIILIVGEIASVWGPDEGLTLPRIVIRTAQELGINLLYYAWRRRQLTGLQHEDLAGQW